MNFRHWSGMLMVLTVALASSQSAYAKPRAPKIKLYPDPVLFSDQPNADEARKYLPVLEEGPGKGSAVYYKGRTYQAWVDANGALACQPLSMQGEPIGPVRSVIGQVMVGWHKPVRMGKDRFNRPKVIKNWYGRYPIEWPKNFKATDKPAGGKVELKVKLMDDAEFYRSYKFTGESIEVRNGFKDPNKEHPPNAYNVRWKEPGCMKFAPSVELEDRIEALKKYEMRVRGSGSKVYPFSGNDKVEGGFKSVHIKGPFGPDIQFYVDTPRPTIRIDKYPGQELHKGFQWRIGATTNGSYSGSKQTRFTLKWQRKKI